MIIRMGRPLANPQLRAIVSVGLNSLCCSLCFPPSNRLEQNKQRKIRIQIRDLHCLLGLVTKFDSFASFPPRIWQKKWDIRLDLNFRNGQDLTSVKKVWQAGDQIGGRYELLSQFFSGLTSSTSASWIMNHESSSSGCHFKNCRHPKTFKNRFYKTKFSLSCAFLSV